MPRSHEASVASGKKAAETLKEKYGKDHYRNLRAIKRKRRTPGYFGHLKDTGQTDKIAELGRKGAEATKKRKSQSSPKENGGV
jgi:hypothetical protein